VAITLYSPPDLPAVTSHVQGIVVRPAQYMTRELKRQIVRRYEQTRSDYPTITAFAQAESARLAAEGVIYQPRMIARLVSDAKAAPREFRWERMLTLLRAKNPRTGEFWYDHGDLAAHLGYRTVHAVRRALHCVGARGYTIRKRPATQRMRLERGWKFEYRLWESQA
jgi:hypothetical protein